MRGTRPDLCLDRYLGAMLNRRILPCAGSLKGYLQEPEGLDTVGLPCREESVGNTTLAGVSPTESAARLTPSSALQGANQT